MDGVVGSSGVEPFAFPGCQAPSRTRTVYGLGVALASGLFADWSFRTDDFGKFGLEGGQHGVATAQVGTLDTSIGSQDRQRQPRQRTG